jgi:IS605 OrfB family transposase
VFSNYTLKIKIKPTFQDKIILETLANEHRLLYNYLLQKLKEKSYSYKELHILSRDFRNHNNLTISAKSAQNTCIKLIENIKSFYALYKKDKKARFPYKFKSWKYFTSFMYDIGGYTYDIIDNTLILSITRKRMNGNYTKLEFKLPDICKEIDVAKTITFSRNDNNEYFVSIVYSKANQVVDKADGLASIDLGYTNLVTMYSNKMENVQIVNERQSLLWTRINKVRSERDGRFKRKSRKYKKISKTLSRLNKRLSDKSKEFQNQVCKYVGDSCIKNKVSTLYVGDIKVKKIENKKNRKIGGESKSTVSLGRFKTLLQRKAIKLGIEFVSVNEAYTSQTNCLTNEIMYSSDLNIRQHELKPGLFIDRDLNGAINIARKGRGKWYTHDSELDLSLNRMKFNWNMADFDKEEIL